MEISQVINLAYINFLIKYDKQILTSLAAFSTWDIQYSLLPQFRTQVPDPKGGPSITQR
jgi:hypothetical protein